MEPGTAARNLGSCDRPVTNSGLLAEKTTDLTHPCLGFIPILLREHQLSPEASNSLPSKDRGKRQKCQASWVPHPHPALLPARKSQLSESPVALNLDFRQ